MRPIDVDSEVNKFFNDSSLVKDGSPSIVILTGTTGAGKTTIRRSKFKNGYVNVDVADIYISVGGGELFEVSDEDEKKLDEIGRRIARKAIAEKRNIVTELIGASKEELETLIEAFMSIGYKVAMNYVECDPVEAYKRHVNAVKTDPTYMSSYYCQDSHQDWLLKAAALKSGAGQSLDWQELSNVAKKLFHLSTDGNELEWAKRSWQVLGRAGLTSFKDKASRLKAIVRFFALTAIYYDFFSILMEESDHELHAEDYLDALGVKPGDLRLLEGAAIVDEAEPKEVLAALIHEVRGEVNKVLQGRSGGSQSLFISLYRALYPTDNRSDGDLLNQATPQMASAFEWVEQGCV